MPPRSGCVSLPVSQGQGFPLPPLIAPPEYQYNNYRMSSQTPLMSQYLSVKREHPDAIFLFRLGDFYEMFYEDAKTASEILE